MEKVSGGFLFLTGSMPAGTFASVSNFGQFAQV
jgi:hypothetical protein